MPRKMEDAMVNPRGFGLFVISGSLWGCSHGSAVSEEPGERQFEFLAGNPDGMTLPPDPSEPSSELDAAMRAAFRPQPASAMDVCLTEQPADPEAIFQEFDLIPMVNGGACNTDTGHTFTGLPENIVKGVLEVAVRPGDVCAAGNPGPDGQDQTNSDGIVL